MSQRVTVIAVRGPSVVPRLHRSRCPPARTQSGRRKQQRCSRAGTAGSAAVLRWSAWAARPSPGYCSSPVRATGTAG